MIRSSGEQTGETRSNGDTSDSTSLHVSPGFELIDTFPFFHECWEATRKEPIEDRIKRRETEYISRWAELRGKQIDSHRRDSVDWRSVVRRRILPHLEALLPATRRIHNHLAAWIGPLFLKAAAPDLKRLTLRPHCVQKFDVSDGQVTRGAYYFEREDCDDMRRVSLYMNMTFDGFLSGPHNEPDWFKPG